MESENEGHSMKVSTPAEFFRECPLYRKLSFDSLAPDDSQPVYEILNFKQTFDCYCPGCERHSVFRRRTSYADDKKPLHTLYGANVELVFECGRDSEHVVCFVCRVERGAFFKIGQYPSLADLAQADLKKYRSVLGEEDYKELNRAVGLAAHGVGIGAFVYLRRIFERLIEEAHEAERKKPDWDEEAYQKGRMEEKVVMLKHALPSFLVENRIVYPLLSKGIHELTEEECLNIFPVLKANIELVLEENLSEKDRQSKINEATKALSEYHGRLKHPQ